MKLAQAVLGVIEDYKMLGTGVTQQAVVPEEDREKYAKRHSGTASKQADVLVKSGNPAIKNRRASLQYRQLDNSNTKHWSFGRKYQSKDASKNADRMRKDKISARIPWERVTEQMMIDASIEIDEIYKEKKLEFTVNLAQPHVVFDDALPIDDKDYDIKKDRLNQYKHSIPVIKRMFKLFPSKENLEELREAILNWEQDPKNLPSVLKEYEAGHVSSRVYEKRCEFAIRSKSLNFLFLCFATYRLPRWPVHEGSEYSLVLATVPEKPNQFKLHIGDLELFVEHRNTPIFDV